MEYTGAMVPVVAYDNFLEVITTESIFSKPRGELL